MGIRVSQKEYDAFNNALLRLGWALDDAQPTLKYLAGASRQAEARRAHPAVWTSAGKSKKSAANTASRWAPFEALASAFWIKDLVGDQVGRNAFDASIRAFRAGQKHIPLVRDHNRWQEVGLIDELWTDAEGLHVKGRFDLWDPMGRLAHAEVKSGSRKEASIAYNVVKERGAMSGGLLVRLLEDVDLVDVSLEVRGINQATWVRLSAA
jgi:HK97 family phage prohead protease